MIAGRPLFLTIKIRFKNLTKESLPKESNVEAGTFEENDLFGYEMACIKQALSFTEFFKEMSLEECKAF